MPLHPPALKTWPAQALSPDGEVGGPGLPRLLVNIGSTTTSLVGMLLLLTTDQLWWGLGLAAAGLVGGIVRITSARRSVRVLGSNLLLRQIVVIAVGLAYVQQRPGPEPVIWLTVGLLLLGVAAEPLMLKLLSNKGFIAAHLPGLPIIPRAFGRPMWTPVASLVALVAGAVLTVLGWPAWVWLVAVVVTLLVPVVSAITGLRRLRANARMQAGMVAAVADYAPEFVIYAGRTEVASYQVTMWLPYLQRTGRRFMVMTRAEGPGAALAELTDVPVVCCRTVADIESLMVPSLTTVFYPNAASANGQMVRYSHLTHVHIGHGDSDKATSYSPLHAMYDKVFSAGPAAIDRYAKHEIIIPRARFSIVGRPQVELVERRVLPIAGIPEPTVLYAPTWRGHVDETRLYSVPQGEQIVQALLERGATVIFRPHPFNLDIAEDATTVERINQLLRADASRSGRQHVWGTQAVRVMSILDCFNASDAMISDVSGVVSDYLYSGKPLGMYSISESDDQFVRDFPVARAAYLIARDLSNLTAVLDDLLRVDSRADVREQVRSYYLGDFPAEGYSDVFVREADRVVASGAGQVRDASTQGAPDIEADEEVVDEEATDAPNQNGEDADIEGGSSPLEEEARIGVDTAVPSGSAPSRTKTLTRGEILAVGPVLTAVLSVGTVLGGAPTWLVGVLVLATLVPVTWSGNRRLNRLSSNETALGAWIPVRALASVAVVGLALRTGEARTMVWLTLAALLLTLTFEMWVRTSRTVRRLRVRHLSTLKYKNPRPALQGWMFLLGLAPLWLALVLAVVGAPIWFATAVALEVLAVSAYMVHREQQLIAAHWQGMADLKGAIEKYQPEFVVYFASRTGAAYQAGMWMPFFKRIGRRFIVVTRYDESLLPLAALTKSPVVLCRTLGSLEDTLVPSLRAAFYVNNGVTNTHYIEHRELSHIWLNHGDSEKPACFNPVHAIYDTIFAAGQAGVDRYARHGVDIPLEKFEIVGRPQVSGIQEAQADVSTIASPQVLYAPTWIGPYADSRLYSLPQGAEIVRALLERGCTVIFRAHPLNYKHKEARDCMAEIRAILREDREITGRQHLWGRKAEQTMSVEDCFNASDAMVADVSAVVTDYLQSQKPFSIVAAEGNSKKLIEEAPVAVASYPLFGDLSNLNEVLDNLLVHDSLKQQRQATRDYYLGGSPDEDPAEPFLRAARRHLDVSTPEHDALAQG